MSVKEPHDVNRAFADAFNTRDIDNLLALYEEDAELRSGSGVCKGLGAIRQELSELLRAPGEMTSLNNFCMVADDLALLRVDWRLAEGENVIAEGSSAELVRRQADGRWLYVLDHAVGASLPRAGEWG